MLKLGKYLLLGLGHGVNDAIAGYIMGGVMALLSSNDMLVALVAYNALAFGGQILFAKFFPPSIKPKKLFLFCFFIMGIGVVLLTKTPMLAVFLTGLSSALYHLLGGLASTRDDEKTWGLGLFAAPGFLGLAIGFYYVKQFNIINYIHQFSFYFAGLALLFLILFAVFYKNEDVQLKAKSSKVEVDQHQLIMLAIVFLISLRSLAWDVIHYLNLHQYEALIIIGVVALLGKAFGGFMADRFGAFKYTMYALLLSFLPMVLPVSVGYSEPFGEIGTLISVFFLQSTIAPMTSMLLHFFRENKSIAIAISFGLAIFIGMIIIYAIQALNYVSSDVIFVAVLICVILAVPININKKYFIKK